MPGKALLYSMFPFPKAIRAHCRRLLLAFLFISHFGTSKAQEMNLPAYDHTRMHFGFILGINSTNFFVQPVANLSSHFNDTVKSIYSQPKAGFNLGIVAELKIGPYLKLRFVPDLAFSERDLAYSIAGVDTFTVLKRVESTFLDFPLDVKLVSKRLNNIQVYVLGGLKYITDLASQKNVDQSLAGVNATVRLTRNDYAYEAGGGIQFFLPYFKFGLEFKLSQGIRDLMIRDNTIFTQSIETLRSKVFLISFTFEG
jgi:hypothetical protein